MVHPVYVRALHWVTFSITRNGISRSPHHLMKQVMGSSPGNMSLYLLESFREPFEQLEFQLELFVCLWTDLPCVSDDLH